MQGDRRPKRLLIINELRERELSVGDLCEALDLSQSNASQHLAILRDRGVVTSRRQGTSVIYALRGTKVIEESTCFVSSSPRISPITVDSET